MWPIQHYNQLLWLVIIYPILEEIAFRGAIQGYLLQRLPNLAWLKISLANFLTSLCFSLLHSVFRSLLNGLAVFIPSLIFGYFRDRYHHLYISIFLHMYYNLGYFWLFSP